MSTKEFAKIAVGLREHPKILHAGDEAGWVFVCAILWSKEHDTDGFVPEYAATRLTGLRSPTKAISALVEAGLLEVIDGGWFIHDYLDHQESAEDRRSRRRAASDAGRRGAAKRWSSNGNSEPHGVAHNGTHGVRIAEEEEEKEEEPPLPPRGGRARDSERYNVEVKAWAVRHFPGVPVGLVEHFAAQLRSRGETPTAAALRPLIEQTRNAA